MKLSKITKEILVHYICSDCGETIKDNQTQVCCAVCLEPISEKDKFYCLVGSKYENGRDGKSHCHKDCFKILKQQIKNK